jgi:hypothetical protein
MMEKEGGGGERRRGGTYDQRSPTKTNKKKGKQTKDLAQIVPFSLFFVFQKRTVFC